MTPEVYRTIKRIRTGKPVQAWDVQVTHARYRDQRVSFCSRMKLDPIQREHRKGRFYEIEDLEELAAHFPKGGTFVDIGANVGNHTIYAAAFLGAARVIPFEPNPEAYRLLVQNVLLNGLEDRVELARLGVGLADRAAEGFGLQERDRNLGATKLMPGDGKLAVFPADTLLVGEQPDFIKIDVEGMEMAALDGLEQTLARCRPKMLIEVDVENDAAFHAWCDTAGYEVISTRKRYRMNSNYLLAPLPRS